MVRSRKETPREARERIFGADPSVRSAAYGRPLETTATDKNHHGALDICEFRVEFREYAVHGGVGLVS